MHVVAAHITAFAHLTLWTVLRWRHFLKMNIRSHKGEGTPELYTAVSCECQWLLLQHRIKNWRPFLNEASLYLTNVAAWQRCRRRQKLPLRAARRRPPQPSTQLFNFAALFSLHWQSEEQRPPNSKNEHRAPRPATQFRIHNPCNDDGRILMLPTSMLFVVLV